jgi:hypothetical protein
VSCFYYMLCERRVLSIVLYVSYVFFISCFESSPCLSYIFTWTLCTLQLVYSIKLYFSAVLLFVLKCCFILFFVLNDIPTSAFLNSLVIVLVSRTKYEKVAQFFLFNPRFGGLLFFIHSLLWTTIINQNFVYK